MFLKLQTNNFVNDIFSMLGTLDSIIIKLIKLNFLNNQL